MSANLTRSADLAGDSLFERRVAAAMYEAAALIINEDPATTDHERRIAYARRVLADPTLHVKPFLLMCCDNSAISMQPSADAVPDSDIRYVVASGWDAVAPDTA